MNQQRGPMDTWCAYCGGTGITPRDSRPKRFTAEGQVERVAECLWAYEGQTSVDWPTVVKEHPSECKRLRAKAQVLLGVADGTFPMGPRRGFTDADVDRATAALGEAARTGLTPRELARAVLAAVGPKGEADGL